MGTRGLLLAAGAGRRMGGPKALQVDADGTSWLARSVRTLVDGGCDAVTVVLGAGAEDARVHLEGLDVDTVLAPDWAEGMGASLRAGLRTLGEESRAVVSLVDLPDVGPQVVRRLLAALDDPALLARAAYDGRPGHPVLLGREHWSAIIEQASGDSGARDYLAEHAVMLVECGDLATGRDQDRPTGGQHADD
jgi:molybdenum cofactor cytidylyltransferase/nicotine blue oxidoreductase